MASKMYEVFHADGGHGGPYHDFDSAEAAAKVSVKRLLRTNDNRTTATTLIKEYCEAPGGFRTVYRVHASRCRNCNDIHVCVEPA